MPDDGPAITATLTQDLARAPVAPTVGADLGHYQVLLDNLKQAVGADNVLTSDEDRTFFAEDVFRSMETPLAIVRPGAVEELSHAAAAAFEVGINVVPRGGGMSYTDGYLHVSKESLCMDMRRMNRVIEINTEDMYVTVECGCTWKELDEALAPHRVRTPYWGPLSGIKAVVGGALSQNSIFFGAGPHGTAVESVIGLTVVLADGTVLDTGAHSRKKGVPFMKHYGPDLMGLFLADTGAMGFKAVATFRLVQRQEHRRFASFGFDNGEDMVAALSEMSRRGLITESAAFDAGQQSARALDAKPGLIQDIGTLWKVIKQYGPWTGLKIALAGRHYLKNVFFGLHLLMEDKCSAGVKHSLKEVRKISASNNGRELQASLPTIIAAVPFAPVNSMLGPSGERWVPIHGIVSHSQAIPVLQAIGEIFDRYAGEKERLGVRNGYLLVSAGTTMFLIEPVWFYPDKRLNMHEKVLEVEYLSKLKTYDKNDEAAELVLKMRNEIRQVFLEVGAVHLQIGKYYPYQEGLKDNTRELLANIKAMVDPKGTMNPGSLGFGIK